MQGLGLLVKAQGLRWGILISGLVLQAGRAILLKTERCTSVGFLDWYGGGGCSWLEI